MYCQSNGLDKPTGNCSEGWYCVNGSTTDTPSGGTVQLVFSIIFCLSDHLIVRGGWGGESGLNCKNKKQVEANPAKTSLLSLSSAVTGNKKPVYSDEDPWGSKVLDLSTLAPILLREMVTSYTNCT